MSTARLQEQRSSSQPLPLTLPVLSQKHKSLCVLPWLQSNHASVSVKVTDGRKTTLHDASVLHGSHTEGVVANLPDPQYKKQKLFPKAQKFHENGFF